MSNYVHLFSGSFVESNALTHELSKLGIQFIIKDQQNSANLAGFGIPNYLSMYFLLKSLDDYPSSSVFPIANMGVILCSTLLSVLLFKARISKKKAFALGCSILAIILISYFDIL